ncbi:hypothetical protein ACJX0J_008277, partial [Zea mays]
MTIDTDKGLDENKIIIFLVNETCLLDPIVFDDYLSYLKQDIMLLGARASLDYVKALDFIHKTTMNRDGDTTSYRTRLIREGLGRVLWLKEAKDICHIEQYNTYAHYTLVHT